MVRRLHWSKNSFAPVVDPLVASAGHRLAALEVRHVVDPEHLLLVVPEDLEELLVVAAEHRLKFEVIPTVDPVELPEVDPAVTLVVH